MKLQSDLLSKKQKKTPPKINESRKKNKSTKKKAKSTNKLIPNSDDSNLDNKDLTNSDDFIFSLADNQKKDTLFSNPEETYMSSIKKAQTKPFQRFIREYQEKIYSIAFRFLNDSNAADEVVLDVFKSLYHDIGRFKGKHISTLLYRLTIQKCLKLNNLQINRSFYHTSKNPSSLSSIDTLKNCFENNNIPEFFENDLIDLIEKSLKKLDYDVRILLILRDIMHLELEQIADILQTTVKTASIRLYRGRLGLLEILKKEIYS